MTTQTIFALFQEQAQIAPDKPAIERGRQHFTYGELLEAAHKCAVRLEKHCPETPAIAISADDPVVFLTSFLACAMIGRPAMPVPEDIPESVRKQLLTRNNIAALSPETACDKRVNHKIEATASQYRDISPEAEFYWGLTSGTTGTPKIFARSHASWTASFDAADAAFQFPATSRILVPGPLHHSLFLFGAIHALCRCHTLIFLPGAYRSDRMIARLADATHLYAIPFMLNDLLEGRGDPASSLSTIFSGGAKLLPATREQIEARYPGADLVEFYGASETSFISFHSSRDKAPSSSVGKVFPGVHLSIRSNAGKMLAPNETGEITVSSPMLFTRYVGSKKIRESFATGDMGFLDENGFLHLTGRANRMIKSRGLKIHPEPIEAALEQLEEIRHAAIIDLPDRKRGAIAIAALEFTPGHSSKRSQLAAHCRISLTAQYLPRRFYVTETLPKTDSGKLALADIRQALLACDPAYQELK